MITSNSRYRFDPGSNKRALLEALLQKHGVGSPGPSARIPKRAGEGPAHLSFAQQRLWFLEQVSPGSAVYNVPLALRLQGRLNPDLMLNAIRGIVRRHESLRTTFRSENGEPVQAPGSFEECQECLMPIVRLDGLSPEECARRVRDRIHEEASLPFDLTQGPLIRSTLLRIAAEEHVWLLTMHHLVCDGWSIDVFFREFKAIYEASGRGDDSPLPELPIQYADFAVWQRNFLSGERLDSMVNWWKHQLAGAPPMSTLPLDRPRPAMQAYEGRYCPVTLTGDVSRQLRELCREEKVTLFMCLVAASHALLYRYSGQEHLVTGAPVASRDRDETRGLIGLLVNAVPMSIRASGNMTFRDLLRSARDTVLAAFAHQDLPFEKLVDAVGLERTLSHSPVFQVAVSLRQAELERLELQGIAVTPLPAEHQPAKYDVTISFTDAAEISGVFEYNTSLFEEATIARAAGHFQKLVEVFVRNPGTRIADAPMLTQAEERQILFEWNQTAATHPERRCLHQLFELQAERRPEAVAVSFEGQSLTYEELDRRANQIAHYLRRSGVTAETRAGIFFRERSIDMVASILGVLKAGGAYVPFDPEHPRDRVRSQMEDAATNVVLTDSGNISSVPEWPAHRVCVDEPTSEVWGMPTTRLAETPDPDSIAYIIFTSGSTGKPKGVLIRHGGACNLIVVTARDFGVGPGSRVLQFAAVTFDACVLEVFMALTAGAELCLAPRDTVRDATDLARFMREREISAAILPPTMLRTMPTDNLPALRSLMSAGEACTSDIIASHARGRRFVNGYGPTETTVAAAYHYVEDRATAEAVVPIGRPLSNTGVFVLDSYLRPVPIGASGEIHIAGTGLARGYLNQPALTAERFVPNPFSDEPGARMYRSGDLGRFRPDGVLEFLGRADQQVKIRGFRIEPAEIEAALEKHARVRQAAVTVRNDKRNNKKLIAFVVPRENEDGRSRLGPRELRAHLREVLPEYMLPAQIVVIDALPLTPHGKIDYRALAVPEPKADPVESGANPRTPAERELARIWCEVLGLKKVGVHDNFFELGGDSILSIQIVARATQRGLPLNPKHLFQYQTISELAAVAGTEAGVAAEQSAVIGKTPLTPVQRWFFEQSLTDMHHWNQAAVLEAPDSVAPERIAEITRALLDHHDGLRTRFRQAGAEVEAPSGEPPFEVLDLSPTRPEAQAAAMEAAAAQIQASLDLERGPVVRVTLLKLGPGKQRILIVIHHLVVDAVSWQILLDDFNTAFQQLQAGHPVRLPAKTTSFKSWAEHLNEHAQSAQVQAELNYWLSEESMTPGQLPLDYPDGLQANTRQRAKTVQFGLNPDETQELLHHAGKTYHAEIPEVLLATLAQAGAQWRGMKSMLVDVEGHGREPLFSDIDLSRTVGWFTSIYPVKLSMPVSLSFRPGAALKAVKEQLRRIPGRGIGYGLLRYLCASAEVRPALAELPQPEIGFNYLGQVDAGRQTAAAFRPVRESCGPVMSGRGARRHVLEIVASISEGRLLINWTYNEDIHRRSTIDDLAGTQIRMLRLLIAHCKSTESDLHTASGFHTASDFPLAALDERMFHQISEQLA